MTVDRIRKAAKCVYLATEKPVADELSSLLLWAAARIPKHLELRDSMTCIPVVCMLVQDNPMTRSAGYEPSNPHVIVCKIQTGEAHMNSYNWMDKWMQTAHLYIVNTWLELMDTDVIDFQYIRGETNEPCKSQYDPEVPVSVG